MIKEMICISCPRGCHLKVDTDTLKVTGNTCIRGEKYGISEVTAPKRIITSTCLIEGGTIPRISVKSKDPLPKELIFQVMKAINKIRLKAPININDVIIKNVLNTGVDIIATKSVGKKE